MADKCPPKIDIEIELKNKNKYIYSRENLDNTKENKKEIPYKEIIDYLNEKAHTKYRSTSESTKKHIRARYNDGYTIEDFKKVIDVKTKEWLKTDMEKYLRPETLFGSKFENYVNQKEKKSIKQLLDEL